jgi:hypothetical protein
MMAKFSIESLMKLLGLVIFLSFHVASNFLLFHFHSLAIFSQAFSFMFNSEIFRIVFYSCLLGFDKTLQIQLSLVKKREL